MQIPSPTPSGARACTYVHTHTYTYTHTRYLQRELTLHRNQHEINTFYVALKAMTDLWIYLLCLRIVSLAFFPDYSDKEKDSELAVTF